MRLEVGDKVDINFEAIPDYLVEEFRSAGVEGGKVNHLEEDPRASETRVGVRLNEYVDLIAGKRRLLLFAERELEKSEG